MSRQQFYRLRKSEQAWNNMTSAIAYRQYRQRADDIEPTPISIVKREKNKEFREALGDPDLFEVIMGPRSVTLDGKTIKPYNLDKRPKTKP